MKKFLQAIHPVDPAVLDEYLALAKPVQFKRKDIITREGQTEKYLYLVEEGIQRSYYLKEGKEHVVAFTFPPSFSGIPESFLTQTPSKCFLECITSSRLLRISYEDQQQMMSRYREIETLSRKITETVFKGFVERHFELLSFSMEERFRAFTQRSPQLLNSIPHKYIASYLRMDPTNFSKLLNSLPL